MPKLTSRIEVRTFRTAADFVAALRPSNDEWREPGQLTPLWLYRGQRDAAWPLTPSAYRATAPGEDSLLGRLRDESRGSLADWGPEVRRQLRGRWKRPARIPVRVWDQRLNALLVDVMSELLATRWFALLADAVAHPVRIPPWLFHINNLKFGHFTRFLCGNTTGGPQIDDIFAFAQHHGIPTRLLDWTYHPLIAAYFAAEQRESKGGRSGNLAVWALHPDILNCDYLLKRYSIPRKELEFLRAQEGAFTWIPDNSVYMENGRWPTVEEMVCRTLRDQRRETKHLKVALKRYDLPATQAPNLMWILWRERISRAHLMPTFDNVAITVGMMSSWKNDLPNLGS